MRFINLSNLNRVRTGLVRARTTGCEMGDVARMDDRSVSKRHYRAAAPKAEKCAFKECAAAAAGPAPSPGLAISRSSIANLHQTQSTRLWWHVGPTVSPASTRVS
jgi:hypothetical protein